MSGRACHGVWLFGNLPGCHASYIVAIYAVSEHDARELLKSRYRSGSLLGKNWSNGEEIKINAHMNMTTEAASAAIRAKNERGIA